MNFFTRLIKKNFLNSRTADPIEQPTSLPEHISIPESSPVIPPLEPPLQPAPEIQPMPEVQNSPPPTPFEKIKFSPDDPRLQVKLMVIEGSNEKMQTEILNFLNSLNLKFVISLDRALAGKSMEQKLNEYPNLCFAVVILSGDEFVYPKSGKPADARLRAPQKVIFELGYLTAHLGRRQVVGISQDHKNFLLPTDYFQVIYTPYNETGIWKAELKQRLTGCGLIS